MIGIISDGQPGPGRAAMNAAKIAGLPTKVGETEDNIRLSQATLLFVSGRTTDQEDCRSIAKACGDAKRPMMTINVWSKPDTVPPSARLAGLIRSNGFRTINIAGSRGSSDPGEPGKPWTGIEAWTFSYLLDVFTILKGDSV